MKATDAKKRRQSELATPAGLDAGTTIAQAPHLTTKLAPV